MYKYTVVSIDAPVNQTGSVRDIQEYTNLQGALNMRDELMEAGGWYEVVVERKDDTKG